MTNIVTQRTLKNASQGNYDAIKLDLKLVSMPELEGVVKELSKLRTLAEDIYLERKAESSVEQQYMNGSNKKVGTCTFGPNQRKIVDAMEVNEERKKMASNDGNERLVDWMGMK